MLPLLALAALRQGGTPFNQVTFDGLLGPKSLMIQTPTGRMEPPKLSPKQKWEFDWTTSGYVGTDKGKTMRIDLYSQESTQSSVRPESVVRTLLRLYSFNYGILGLDHAREFNRIVTAYLCYGGDPGGEQLFGVDPQFKGAKVNTVYFYDLKSFTDPVEATREVAHEYGHATLPPIGGEYTAPEAWANGYLGEKVYMRYLAKARHDGALGPADTFGATPEALALWVKKNVNPLVADALLHGPRPALLAGKDKAAMDAFFGLALTMEQLYGPRLMRRALELNGTDPKRFPDSAATAAEEPNSIALDVPEALRSKPIWVPMGTNPKKSVIMGAAVLERRQDGWTRVQPYKAPAPIIVRNYRD